MSSRAVFFALYADDSPAFIKDVSWTENLIPGGCCCLNPALNTGYWLQNFSGDNLDDHKYM